MPETVTVIIEGSVCGIDEKLLSERLNELIDKEGVVAVSPRLHDGLEKIARLLWIPLAVYSSMIVLGFAVVVANKIA